MAAPTRLLSDAFDATVTMAPLAPSTMREHRAREAHHARGDAEHTVPRVVVELTERQEMIHDAGHVR